LELILRAAIPLMQFIANTRDVVGEAPTVSPVDGGVKSSVDVSLMGLCSRLDRIVADESNWSLTGYRQMEEQYSKLIQAHTAAMEAQRKTNEMITRPHVRLHPTLVRLDIGGWAAFTGDIGTDSAIVGIGDSPAGAMESFDRVFEGLLESATFKTDVETIEQKNEKTPMDPSTRSTPPQPEERGKRRKPRRKTRNY
jgi:hypothetical protein